MPKKVIGQELTQEDYQFLVKRIRDELKALDVTTVIHLEANGWLAVNASCSTEVDGDLTEHSTHVTYITSRGPHMTTVLCRHVTSLYMIVDRYLAGLPPPIGW